MDRWTGIKVLINFPIYVRIVFGRIYFLKKRRHFSIYVRMYSSHNSEILLKWKLVRRIKFAGSDSGDLLPAIGKK